MNQLLGVSLCNGLLSQVVPRLALIDISPLLTRRDVGPFLIVSHADHPLSQDRRDRTRRAATRRIDRKPSAGNHPDRSAV